MALEKSPAHPASAAVSAGGSSRSGAPAVPPAPGRVPPLDREVLEAFRRRESAALETFFDHYFDLVFGLVLRLLGNRTAAEDVTQEVFFKVYRAADRLDP